MKILVILTSDRHITVRKAKVVDKYITLDKRNKIPFDPDNVMIYVKKGLLRTKHIPVIFVDEKTKLSYKPPVSDSKYVFEDYLVEANSRIRITHLTTTLLQEEQEKIRKLVWRTVLVAFITIIIVVVIQAYISHNMFNAFNNLADSIRKMVEQMTAPPK